MSVKYKFSPICDNLNEEGEKAKGYYPRVVSRGTIHKEQLFDTIALGSPMLRAELSRSWMLIESHIMQQLENGYDVCINGFGTFSLSAESRLVEQKNEIRAESISVKGLNFRPSKTILNKLKKTRFEREPEKK